jgi:hypothetical protein
MGMTKSPLLPGLSTASAVSAFQDHRTSLIAHRSSAWGSVLQRADKILEDRVSARVTLFPDFSQQYDAIAYFLRNALHDILRVGIQLRRPLGTRLAFQSSVGIPLHPPALFLTASDS